MYSDKEAADFCQLVRTSEDSKEICYAFIDLLKKLTPEDWDNLRKCDGEGE